MKEQSSRGERAERGMLRMLSCMCLIPRLFDSKAYLGVFHYTLDAVKVGEVTDWLVGIVQHSSDGLGDE